MTRRIVSTMALLVTVGCGVGSPYEGHWSGYLTIDRQCPGYTMSCRLEAMTEWDVDDNGSSLVVHMDGCPPNSVPMDALQLRHGALVADAVALTDAKGCTLTASGTLFR